MDNVLDEWQEFIATVSAGEPHRDLILLSWSRSRLAGVGKAGTEIPLRRVSNRELRALLRESQQLVA
ncbi:MAG TPA: hypothetical protein VK966_02615, partial [Longimicrobiales bacterium]|nr:hypothetical protein [Longimicrobiales bacterium]